VQANGIYDTVVDQEFNADLNISIAVARYLCQPVARKHGLHGSIIDILPDSGNQVFHQSSSAVRHRSLRAND
jgi:hypothetical protein